jgi:hypothetical protein
MSLRDGFIVYVEEGLQPGGAAFMPCNKFAWSKLACTLPEVGLVAVLTE